MSNLWDRIKPIPIMTFSMLLSSCFVAPMSAQRCENPSFCGFESCMGIIVSVWDWWNLQWSVLWSLQDMSVLKARVKPLFKGKKPTMADKDISICIWDMPVVSSPMIQGHYSFVTQHYIKTFSVCWWKHDMNLKYYIITSIGCRLRLQFLPEISELLNALFFGGSTVSKLTKL